MRYAVNMDKQAIIDEIKRTAVGNDGKPLGKQRFEAETGIRPHEWQKYWARYGDAVRDAGLDPNKYNLALDQNDLLRRVVDLARELGKFPTHGDLRVKRTADPNFPSKGVFEKFRVPELKKMVGDFCATNPGNDDVSAFCQHSTEQRLTEFAEKFDTGNDGFVYLMKSGRFHKIGRTNSIGMREYTLKIQLPDEAKTVHHIKTDDPVGIEAYWHKRFEAKRRNGEWFDLSAQDVSAFRRRKFM